MKSPQNTLNKPKCLAAGPTIPEGFNDKNKTLIMNDTNGSGGSAVVVASRGGNSIMRKLYAL